MDPERDTRPVDGDDETMLPETVREVGEADTLRWIPIARRAEPAPETRRYGSGL
jgi:hypothetical protein